MFLFSTVQDGDSRVGPLRKYKRVWLLRTGAVSLWVPDDPPGLDLAGACGWAGCLPALRRVGGGRLDRVSEPASLPAVSARSRDCKSQLIVELVWENLFPTGLRRDTLSHQDRSHP